MLYDKLVEKILSNEKLKGALDHMVLFSNSINLVTPDWEKVLKDSIVYQKHVCKDVKFSKGKPSKKNFHIRNIIGLENSFDVIVAGIWSLNFKDDSLTENNTVINNAANNTNNNLTTSIYCRMCQPLFIIGQSMAEHDGLELAENCRFFMDKCNISVCDKCFKYKRGYDVVYNDWCVKSTKIFDGENVKGMLKQNVEDAFGMNSFCGILRLNIYSRFTFGENRFKIGGKCKDMILFNENSLLNDTSFMNLYGNELSLPSTPLVQKNAPPQITFEDENPTE